MSFRRPVAVLAALLIVVAACGGPFATVAPSAVVATPSAAVVTYSASACPDQPTPGPTGETTWWTDRVFYEVFVRSFADSDGDGIGDLAGLTGRLDKLNDGDPATTSDLGVTALWLMPVAESPSYHGYDVTDYLTVEPDYGTNDDFKALVAAASPDGQAGMPTVIAGTTEPSGRGCRTSMS